MSPVIMFDFDGVIADSYEAFFGTFTSVCTDMSFDKLNSREAFLKLFEGNMIQQLVKAGFPVWRLKKLVKQFQPRITEANKRVRPFAGMPEIISRLAAVHPVYVITSNVSETVAAFLDTFGAMGVKDVLGADKETSKVKKIKKVRKGHPGQQSFYIGDTKGDIVEGKTAGATTVAAAWGWHPVETLQEAKPDHLLHSPQELLTLFSCNP
ncbi:MAG TPA: HAD hydrolase-like protein [Candidatus Hydrogenedentes bacterium]|nr:HAD hydrolase-like protein [Candidatus Hydrogenedentota bacterium]